MSPEAQRIAIAEACGIKLLDIKPVTLAVLASRGYSVFSAPSNGVLELPDYLHDLNAMHEAEKVLTTDKQVEGYNIKIYQMVQVPDGARIQISDLMIHATAAQRAEAFLRTIGKWEDDK